MQFTSTRNQALRASFGDCTLKGLAEDKGLFVPAEIPSLPSHFNDQFKDLTNTEIASRVLSVFTGKDIEKTVLDEIVSETFNFIIPLTQITDNIYSLELFHGPTLSFKDVGARFLARCTSHLNNESKLLNVLVATSGDTGSAVANGFWKMQGINVFILFPRGGVSDFQEYQMTSLGENVTALEVDGTFDDCQHLVKTAFGDVDLNRKIRLTSANSINIARWIAQSVYYFLAVKQLPDLNRKILMSVPTGNLGNLTAGLLAKKMGLRIDKFVSATNKNRVVTDYIETGSYESRPSVTTISNAMDVGSPSNFERLMYLYDNDYSGIVQDIESYSYSDTQTIGAIQNVYQENQYLMDPHGAVSYLALQTAMNKLNGDYTGVFLETASPSKFEDSVKRALPTIQMDHGHFAKDGYKVAMENNFEALVAQLNK